MDNLLCKMASAFALCLMAACTATQHPTTKASLGARASSDVMEASLEPPGPLTVESIVAARWEVDLSGLLNLNHPDAKAAHLSDRAEPIELYVHVIKHPKRGTFLVDSGVERAFAADPDHALLHGMLASLAHVDRLKVLHDTHSIVQQTGPIAGVLLTHLHADHVLGLRDVPASTPIYVGPGDAEERSVMNLVMRGVYDQALAAKQPLHVLEFEPQAQGSLDGVLDVFGDGSLWAIWTPGHTPGSVAFVARTPQGPVLLTGDACHTAWGWEHSVEPGTFSDDAEQSATSFAKLQRFAKRHPSLDIRLGHQQLATAAR